MSHPFGDLLSQFLHRRHGLSQSKLADGILQTPSVISEMCQGKRLTGPQARERVVAVIRWLHQQAALDTLDDVNALLDAAGMSPLHERDPVEAELIRSLHSSPRGLQGRPLIAAPSTHQGEAPPGDALRAPVRHNLPPQLTPFVGRAEQIAYLVQQVQTHRLLTLTGAGGVGKTRLALEVAAHLLDAFADGIWFVDLAPLSDPAMLPQSVMDVLQAPEQPTHSPLATLTTYLGAKHLLLVLDNCEHLIDAAAGLAEQMLRACPQVRLLATSRVALHIGVELPWRVPSLTRPPLKSVIPGSEASVPGHVILADEVGLSSADLEHYEAVSLFVARVRSLQPAFALSPDNTWAVAQICSRLDGIPLALEMAAAQVNVLTVEEIAARLSGAIDARFQLLTSAARTAPRRQQTLRATLEWSYALLTLTEQRLLARLSVFAGGWTAEAAEAVCADAGEAGILPHDVWPLLAQLVYKSLVIADQHSGQTRYRMLETIRQFAVERLRELGEAAAMRERHLAYFLTLAEQPPIEMLAGPPYFRKMGRLHAERDNLRAALTAAHGRADDGELCLRLAGALWFFWFNHGYHSEGLARLQEALAQGGNASVAARGKVSVALAYFHWGIDTGPMAMFAEEGLALCRQGHYQFGIAYALALLAEAARRRRDHARAQSLFDESLLVSYASSSPEAIWNALFLYGLLLQDRGEPKQAAAFFAQSIALAQQWSDPRYMFYPLRMLSTVDSRGALAMCRAELAQQQEAGDPEGTAIVLHALGCSLLEMGNYTEAQAALAESLMLWRNLGLQWHWVGGTARVLWDLGRAAWLLGDHEAAAAHYADSLKQFREVSDNEQIALVQTHRGYAALARSDPVSADVCFRESLQLLQVTGGLAGDRYVPIVLVGLAQVAVIQGDRQQAARLFGAAERLGAMLPHCVPPSERIGYERLAAAARTWLDDAGFATAWAAGQAMTLDEAIAYALENEPNRPKPDSGS
jgi:predicted ATPase